MGSKSAASVSNVAILRQAGRLTHVNILIIVTWMMKIAVVTGATRNLGLALVEGLARRLAPDDVVYLTGRNPDRVTEAERQLKRGSARVVGAVLDVADGDAVRTFAEALQQRHGGVDIVFSNHYHRTDPQDDPADVIDDYVATNNLGTTHVLRSFAPLIRDGGRLLVVASRAGSLRALAPALHSRFERAATLDDVDGAVCAWRDAVRERRAAGQAWPAWINIPSKIAQVAAVRALATERRESDLRRGILVAAVSPGLFDTGASRPWLDMTGARSPEDVAPALVEFALETDQDPALYGQLIHLGSPEPVGSSGVLAFKSTVPWK
jgi:NAD(P)-dependent dehydrogenase (short-subunit alcohol dehydrogenase family)